MRVINFAVAAVLTFQVTFSAVGNAATTLPKALDTKLPYPAAVSLRQEPTGWTFRQSRTDLPLYFNDKNSLEKSVCDSECEKQWVPLLVTMPDEKSLGQWTIFVRSDGRRQWAFEKHPVYLHVDTSPVPATDVAAGDWHLMPHFPSPAK